MKTLFTLFAISTMLGSSGQSDHLLYPVAKGSKWGYINSAGSIVIKPQFLAAGFFSEGLAPVRQNGTYGYIHTDGQFAIAPYYDAAFNFVNGIAKVYIDGKPYFIDTTGHKLFEHGYIEMSAFSGGSRSIVRTASNKCGVINPMGQLVIDTVFLKIGPFANGRAVVAGLNHLPYSRDTTKPEVFEIGVIDTAGNFIVKYGKYKEIKPFLNGYAEVEALEDDAHENDEDGVIDSTGRFRFPVRFKDWSLDYNHPGFYQNLAVVQINSKISRSSNDDYVGIINPNGKILFSDLSWKEMTPFTYNRAFVQNKKEQWILIDTKGKQVGDTRFTKILYDDYREDPSVLFQNGIAFVETNDGVGAIDTTGNWVIWPRKFEDFEYSHLLRRGDVVFFEDDISTENENYSYQYGFWNAKKNVVVKPQFHDINMEAFDQSLIYVMEDGKSGYINATGKQIWKETTGVEMSGELNIDFMNRGYFYASSKPMEKLSGYGGWGHSDNESKKMTDSQLATAFGPRVLLKPDKSEKWMKKYEGMQVLVVNASRDTVYFDAQDSRLYMKLQAKDKNGEWKDIEYLPSSWCGNSYHMVFLASGEGWEFTAPVYHGGFKTKIRAELLYIKAAQLRESEKVYSNEIDGEVNPGQFWNKRQYYRRGLMDPYND